MYAGTGLVRFEYKDFAFIGPESLRAAEAAACANEQGQFWPYHNILFANQMGENQGAFSKDTLQAFAAALALDESAFNNCLDSGRYRNDIAAETATAREREVRSTPTLFFNGKKLEGAVPFEQLQPMIEAAIANSGTTTE
ncbi:MAG: thioredoxin domain-containing protein [Aquificales bacterium]|nr:thioredoxin domain-containing protein [Aquificales bacterium]